MLDYLNHSNILPWHGIAVILCCKTGLITTDLSKLPSLKVLRHWPMVEHLNIATNNCGKRTDIGGEGSVWLT
jgi:hypothetical protein